MHRCQSVREGLIEVALFIMAFVRSCRSSLFFLAR